MATLDEEDGKIAVLYYGEYGTGKTTALAHMANVGVTKYIRTDKGLKARPLRQLGVDTSRIEPVDSFSPISLERMADEWRELLEADPSALAGVVIDTVTEWVGRRIEVYVDKDWDRYQTRQRRGKEEIDELMRYTSGDGQDQFKGVTQEGRRLVRSLYDLPCHLGLGCQMRRDVDKDTGLTRYGPAVNPAFQGDLIGYADFVIRIVQEGTWPDGRPLVVGYPRPSATHVGKDRYSVLPSRLADPVFTRVLAYSNGTLTKDTDEVQAEYRAVVRSGK